MNRHRACDDFHRTSDSRRRDFLGSPITRRQVIARGLGAGVAIYASKLTPLERMFEAAEASAQAAPNAPVLVSVFLPGGTDLLDTLVPFSQYDAYADKRRGIKIAEDAPRLGGSGLGLHPELAKGDRGGVKALFDQGKIGFLPGIDYANPDLSHFHSRHFWETGLITQQAATGWLGRFLDRGGSPDNPFQGISVSHHLQPVMRSSRVPVAAVTSPDDSAFWMPGVWGPYWERTWETWGALAGRRPYAPGPAAAHQSARLAKQVSDTLAPYRSEDDVNPLAGPVVYPEDNELASRLKSLAGMLTLPLGIRVAAVSADGDFDTHDSQPGELARGLADVSTALDAFQADLEARGIADRVLTFVWSEFGRRVEQNESNGTDHGAGGLAWVQGTRVRSGILSDYPDIRRLDQQGNLSVTVDFRRVYSSLLEQWLGTDANAVIPNSAGFGRVQLVR
jgi:uncharacterized protein (DUF1501 family)